MALAEVNTAGVIDTLRINESQLQAILAEIRSGKTVLEGSPERRQNPRVSITGLPPFPICIATSPGNFSRYQARLCDLSAGGLSFLNGTFTYEGTRCVSTLQTIDGQPMDMPGLIVRCKLLSGRIHELGVKFDQSIELSNFITNDGSFASSKTGATPASERESLLAPFLKLLADQMPQRLTRLKIPAAARPNQGWIQELNDLKIISAAIGASDLAQSAGKLMQCLMDGGSSAELQKQFLALQESSRKIPR